MNKKYKGQIKIIEILDEYGFLHCIGKSTKCGYPWILNLYSKDRINYIDEKTFL